MKKIQITLEQLFGVLDKKFTYVAIDEDLRMYAYINKPIICVIWWQGDGVHTVCDTSYFEVVEFANKPWTECIAERPSQKPDYSKWIGKIVVGKNRDEEEFIGIAGRQSRDNPKGYLCIHPITSPFNIYFCHDCRPATKEEVEKYLIDSELEKQE